MALNNKFYFPSPVEVVKVTPKNLKEVAEWCGGKVAKVESRRVKGRIDSYVWVPTPKGAAISWAFPGMFITKRLAVTEKDELKETFSVFRKDYFNKNYFSEIHDAVDKTWERQVREQNNAAKEARTITVVVNEGVNPMEVAVQINNLLAEAPVSDEPAISLNESLPDSMVAQRETLHEEQVEAEAETA